MSKTETTYDPLSSEAMYEKHAATVAEQHALLKKKRKRRKQKEQEGEVYLLKGEYKVTYEFADGDSTLFQSGVGGASLSV